MVEGPAVRGIMRNVAVNIVVCGTWRLWQVAFAAPMLAFDRSRLAGQGVLKASLRRSWQVVLQGGSTSLPTPGRQSGHSQSPPVLGFVVIVKVTLEDVGLLVVHSEFLSCLQISRQFFICFF